MNKMKAPEGVGPHEGKELELMLKGEKPLAMFFGCGPDIPLFPIDAFQTYVDRGQVIMKRYEFIEYGTPLGDLDGLELYYALPDEAWRIEEMHRIRTELSNKTRTSNDETEILIGKLLGYTKWEIDQYLAWSKKALSQFKSDYDSSL
ncbi:MAG: hypothetical protein GY804_00755 [Alphaproteobacteria bacterium]|nr:hypothetical protein [Alphaproteobacteria bacterium]